MPFKAYRCHMPFYDWFTWYKNLETNEVIGDDVYALYRLDDPEMEDWVEISPKEARKMRELQIKAKKQK
jgi:hypothetical protein